MRERIQLRQLGFDIIVRRVRATWLGWPWLVIRPVMSALGLTFLFGLIIGVKTGTTPYFLFIIVSQAVWGTFEQAMERATRALWVTKSWRTTIVIPKPVAVTAFFGPALFELVIALVIAGIVTVGYRVIQGTWHVTIGMHTLLIFPAIALCLVLAYAIGMWTAVWGENLKDVRYLLSYAMGLWGFITPVMYPVSQIPAELQWTVPLNPAALPVLLGREAFFGNSGLSSRIVTGNLIGIGVLLAISPFSNLIGRRREGTLEPLSRSTARRDDRDVVDDDDDEEDEFDDQRLL